MKQKRRFDRKLALLVLRTLYKGRKTRVATINSYTLAQNVSKKKLITVVELDEVLSQLSKLGLIEYVAKNAQKGYNYRVKLKNKGEVFLKENSSKASDFFIGIFVYLLFMALLVLLVFSLRKIFAR